MESNLIGTRLKLMGTRPMGFSLIGTRPIGPNLKRTRHIGPNFMDIKSKESNLMSIKWLNFLCTGPIWDETVKNEQKTILVPHQKFLHGFPRPRQALMPAPTDQL